MTEDFLHNAKIHDKKTEDMRTEEKDTEKNKMHSRRRMIPEWTPGGSEDQKGNPNHPEPAPEVILEERERDLLTLMH